MKKYLLIAMVAVIAILGACTSTPEKATTQAPAPPVETAAPMPQDTAANLQPADAKAEKEGKDDDD